MSERKATVERNTLETQISVTVNLDGSGKVAFDTGIPFLEHMLDQVARHGMIDMEVTAKGDLHIDAHHTVEDIGIALGQAFASALSDKRGIRRYGHAYVPLDEALALVTLHIDCLRGDNAHHIAETVFKAFGRAVRMALEVDTAMGDRLPSTKGSL
jgi:imidazoleglycerol-phosphate dehydratase